MIDGGNINSFFIFKFFFFLLCSHLLHIYIQRTQNFFYSKLLQKYRHNIIYNVITTRSKCFMLIIKNILCNLKCCASRNK